MEMKFLIDGQEHIGAVDGNGYVSVTFTKNTRDDIEIIPLESCGGVTFVDEIQLEKGDIATPYENPALVQGPATGLIKDIRAMQYSIHDPERGLTSRFAQMAQGFEQEVVDLIGGYSRQGQTIDGLFTDMYSPDGRFSQSIQTVDGFKQTVKDLEAGTGTTFEQLSNGFRQRIDEYLGNSAKFSQITSSVSAIELVVGDADSMARQIMTSSLWQTEVTNVVEGELEQERENTNTEISSRITQLNNMISLGLFNSEDALTRIALGEEGIQIDGELLHITAKTYIDNGVIKNAMIDNLSASKINTGTLDASQLNVINIDFNSLVGNKTSFLESLWEATNSRSVIDGTRIRLESGTQGAYVELNNIPEFRSQFHDGTAVVMAKGRTQFFEPNGGSQGYIGRDIHTGTNDFGIFISRGKGFRIARATDSSSSVDDKFYTVKSGMTWRVAIIEDMVRSGILQDGDSQKFVENSNYIARLNGWPILPQDWPTLRAGDQVMYEKGKVVNDGGTGVTYEDVMNFGKNGALTEWWLYMRQHVRFEASYSSASDRRIKHDIQPTKIGAIEAINELEFKEFKMNRDNRYVPLGLIAQDSGLLRIEDPVNEALNMELATLLSLKGVQELKKEIDDLKEQIKSLQNGGST